MIRETKSIGELQAEIEAAFSRLRRAQLPAGLEPLRYLAPPRGLAAQILLQYKDGRKIKRTVDAGCWDPQSCKAVLTFELEDDEEGAEGDEGGSESDPERLEIESHLRDLLLALDAAERDVRFVGFVGIKAFRDQFLLNRGLAWANDQQARHYSLAAAINSGLVLRTSVPNPNRPDFPTTAVKLNREHPTVREVLRATEADRAMFKPVRIRGKSLSSTVIEERR